MFSLRRSIRPLHRVALLATACAVAMVSCGREQATPVTAAGTGTIGARIARGISFQPVFPAIVHQLAGQVADGNSGVDFNRVHVVLHHADGSVALDTTVNFPAGADELTVSLDVPLEANAPADGEALSLNLGYINAAGVTVFEGGPVTVNATPSVPGQPPPPPVEIPVTYTGPGATAKSVSISPKALTVFAGAPISFTAVALDGNGTTVPNTPIVFAVLDGPATVGTGGSGTAGASRGVAHIAAQLLTGPTDVATLTVTLPATAISYIAGTGQTGVAGSALGAPVVAQVTASDGVGVGGVSVSFAAAGGGSMSPSTVTSDAGGMVSSTWTLGSTPGPQTATATSSAGGGTVSFAATALPKPAKTLVVSTAPATTPSLTGFAVAVTAKDADGNVATGFTGTVTLAVATGPAAGALTGATTATAAAGVASFTGLQLNATGTYTLAATSGALAQGTSGAIVVTPGKAAKLFFSTEPTNAVAGRAMAAVAVTVQDGAGNLATNFTGNVVLSLNNNPGAATLAGNTSNNAIAGIAMFGGLSLSRPGSGYNFQASSAGVGTTLSDPFDVAVGPAGACTIASGNNQAGTQGAALAAPIVVAAVDALGNPVMGATVTVTVASGGGSVNVPSALTNAQGQASFTWTLGNVAGAQTLSITCTGVVSPTIATATAGGPGGTTIGYSTLFPPPGSSHYPDFLLGNMITVSSTVTLDHIALISYSSGQHVQMALYSDANGHPSQLVSVTGQNLVAVGVNEFAVTPVVLEPGNYWIMAIYDVQASVGIVYNNPSDVVDYISLPFGSPLPAVFPSPTVYTGQGFNYYIRVH